MANRICEILSIEKPVIQGPMVWLTDAFLAAAVINAGGMGISQIYKIKSVKAIIDDMTKGFF